MISVWKHFDRIFIFDTQSDRLDMFYFSELGKARKLQYECFQMHHRNCYPLHFVEYLRFALPLNPLRQKAMRSYHQILHTILKDSAE